jgi:mRNA-degrading endonuclease YafQ of YafQ-DinJ toxin-antitoxin module
MPTIILTDLFNNDFRKLSSAERKQARKTLGFMAVNPKHNSLKIYRIKGTGFWEAYVNKDIRVIFEQNSDTLILHAIGHHDILREK